MVHSLSSGLPLYGISRSQPPGPPGGRGSRHDAHLVTAERAEAGGESMATATLASALSDRALADVVAGCAAAPAPEGRKPRSCATGDGGAYRSPAGPFGKARFGMTNPLPTLGCKLLVASAQSKLLRGFSAHSCCEGPS
jgi:hypothetical protein